jgi:single-strand DNA-binding protein
MLNKAIIIGRITRDPELRTTANGVSVCNFTLAVNRRFKNANGEYDTDFINCVAWRQQAELICKHFSKGSQLGIVGNIQTRNYDDKDGKKVFVTEVAVDELHFVGNKKEDKGELPDMPQMPINEGFLPMPDDTGDLPF